MNNTSGSITSIASSESNGNEIDKVENPVSNFSRLKNDEINTMNANEEKFAGANGDDSDSIVLEVESNLNDSTSSLIGSGDVDNLINGLDKDLNANAGTSENTAVTYTKIKDGKNIQAKTADSVNESSVMIESENIEGSEKICNTSPSDDTSPVKSCHTSCSSTESTPISKPILVEDVSSILVKPDDFLITESIADRKLGRSNDPSVAQKPRENSNRIKRKSESADGTPKRKSLRLLNRSNSKGLKNSLEMEENNSTFESEASDENTKEYSKNSMVAKGDADIAVESRQISLDSLFKISSSNNQINSAKGKSCEGIAVKLNQEKLAKEVTEMPASQNEELGSSPNLKEDVQIQKHDSKISNHGDQSDLRNDENVGQLKNADNSNEGDNKTNVKPTMKEKMGAWCHIM